MEIETMTDKQDNLAAAVCVLAEALLSPGNCPEGMTADWIIERLADYRRRIEEA